MEFRSLVLKTPEGRPYDRHDWFYSFLGNFALNAISDAATKGLINKFWFGQYDHEPFKRFVRLRYLTSQPNEASQHFAAHAQNSGLLDITQAIGELNYAATEFLDQRFCGNNARKLQAEERREAIVELLHSASVLTLQSLSHVDADGYWQIERNQDTANNPTGSFFDSVFHLLGNTCSHTPIVVELNGGILSATHFNILQSQGAGLKQGKIHKINL